MRKTILTILGSAALGASFVQLATATEHHHARKTDHAVVGQTLRASNAAWGSSYAQPNWSRYEGGAISAPAGH